MRFYDSLEKFVEENPNMIYRVWTKEDYYNDEDCLKYKIYGIIKTNNDYILQMVDPYEFNENNKYIVWYHLNNIHIETTDYDLEDHDD